MTVRPFLSTIASSGSAQPRSLASALTGVPNATATSPWSPREDGGSSLIDVSAIEAAARDRGREQGLAETAELRAQLAKAITVFTTARATLAEPVATKIAAAAAAVVVAWTDTASPAELYAPIVRAWIARHDGPATAHIAPAHVAALAEMIGEAPIAIVPDASLRHGDVRLSSSTLELSHHWEARLGELRDAIVAALEAT